MGRYTEIQSFCKPLYIKNSPVVTGKVAVFYDSAQKRRVVLSKTHNLSPKTIKSATVSYKFYDKEGHPLGDGLSYTYEDLSVVTNETFGEKVLIQTNVKGVYKAVACTTKVVFEDGSSWQAAPDAQWGIIKLPASISRVLPHAYQKLAYTAKFGESARFAYEKKEGLQICTCATINGPHLKNCFKCGASFEALDCLDHQALKKEGMYLAAENALRSKCDKKKLLKIKSALQILGDYQNTTGLIQTIDNRLEQIKQRNIKRKKRAVKLSCLAAALAVFTVAAVTVFIPWMRMLSADKHFNQGNYEKALSIYEDIDGFGRSEKSAAAVHAITDLHSDRVENAITNLLEAEVPVHVVYDKNLTSSDTVNPADVFEMDYQNLSSFNALETAQKTGYSLDQWDYVSHTFDPKVKNGIFTVSLKADWDANDYTISYENTYYKDPGVVVTFYGNYYGAETITKQYANGQTLEYPTPPTREGYAFAGWYANASYSTPYNFTNQITSDLNLYAKWVPMSSSLYATTREYVDVALHNSESTAKTLNVTASGNSAPNYYYFTCYQAGSYTLYVTLTTGDFYISVYNATTDTIIQNNYNMYGSKNYKAISFKANAGDVLYVKLYKWSSTGIDGACKMYVKDFDYPTSTAHINGPTELVCRYEHNKTATATVTYDQPFTLYAPTRTGYAFDGWYYNDAPFTADKWNIASDIVLESRWIACDNVITLNTNGGTIAGGQSTVAVTYDQPYTLPTPTKTGYTFMGWKNNGILVTSGKWEGTSNITLTAEWIENNYQLTLDDVNGSVVVTFDPNYSGSTPTTVTVEADQTLAYPTPPIRSGYAFEGWYTNSACTSLFTFSGSINSNITLYARWRSMESSYTSREYVDIANYNNSSSKKSITISASYSSSPNYYYFTCYQAGTYTLYAAYTSGDFYITVYNATQSTTVLSRTNLYISNSSKSVSFTVRAGDVLYVSLYKYNSSSSTAYGTFYVSGATYPTSTAIANGTHLPKYSADSSITQTVTYGQSITLPTPTRTGYTFLGWYDAQDQEFTSDVWNLAANTTLTPKWQAITNTISLDANGGTIAGGQSSVAVTYDQPYTLPTPTKTGYTFAGWKNGSETVTSGTWQGTANLTLTAEWTANTYSLTLENIITNVMVTFDYNDGISPPLTVQLDAGQTLDYPAIPTRSGYVFAGWYTDSACTSKYSFSGTLSASMTLYAKWLSYTGEGVLYVGGNSGNITFPARNISNYRYYAFVPLVSGTVTIYSSNSSADTYGFLFNSNKTQLAYNDDNGSNRNFQINYSVTAGKLYYVVPCAYSSNSYCSGTVYISGTATPTSTATAPNNSNSYAENSSVTVSVTYGQPISLPTPTRTGYTFLGWYDENDQLITASTWNFTSNKTLTPKWQ